MNPNVRAALVTSFWIFFVLASAGIIQGIEDGEDLNARSIFSQDFGQFLSQVNKRGEKIERDIRSGKQKGIEQYLTEEQLMDFLFCVEKPLQRRFLGTTSLGNQSKSHPTWKYKHSVLFICALVTTVGYGNIIPLTEAGKGFSVFVTLFGAPLTAVFYYVWIERLLTFTSVTNRMMFDGCKSRGMSSTWAKAVPMCVVITAVATGIIFVPATFFYSCEDNWSYLTAIYYCSLTLATAGLGDFVPMESDRCGDAYVLITAIYIVSAVFVTTFMTANLFDIYEIGGDDDVEELTPLKSNEFVAPQSLPPTPPPPKAPSPVVQDLYLTGIGK